MSLTLLQNPAAVAFARNQCIVKLRADDGVDLFDAVGVTSKLAYTDTDRFDSGDTITIDYDAPDGTSETVVFTAVSSPADFDEIPDSSFSGSDTEYWSAVRVAVASNPRIAPYFTVITVNESGRKLRIRARNTDDGWTLTVTNSAGFAVTNTDATDSTLPANYKVMLEVFVEQTYEGGDFELGASLEGYPEAETGLIYFDLSTVLAAESRASRVAPVTPAWSSVTPFICDNFRRYFFRYTEQYGDPIEVQQWLYSQVKEVIDGGIPDAVFAAGDYLGGVDKTNSIFTWLPDGSRVGTEQPVWLAWYNYNTVSKDVFLSVTWYNVNDNTSTDVNVFDGSPLTVGPKEIAVFPVSPRAIGLDTEDDCFKYRVKIGDAGGVGGAFGEMSPARTFFIDREYYPEVRYIQYLNAFGAPECWRHTGYLAKKINIDRSVARRALAPNYTANAVEENNWSNVYSIELTYRTGLLTAAEAQGLIDMLTAEGIYDVSASGITPLRMVTGSFKVTETYDDRHAYEFTAIATLTQQNINQIQSGESSESAWLLPDGTPWLLPDGTSWLLPT